MDLTAVLLRFAAGSPRVLLVPVPGHPRARRSIERELACRGWPEAAGPADADVLLVAGHPGPELAAVIDDVWTRIPAPRVRVEVTAESELSAVLDSVVVVLADPATARAEARSAAAAQVTGVPSDPRPLPDEAGHDHDPSSGEVSSGPGHSHHAAEHDHAPAADGGGHADHDSHHGHHHDGGMPLPGGLSMADLAEDRDGLTLDTLHLPLGPILAQWPAGLVVDVAMQGDVIASARARLLDEGPRPLQDGHGGAPDSEGTAIAVVRDLDAVARLLGVAGWDGPAGTARYLRDRLGDGEPVESLHGPGARWLRRVRRSRVLRLMLARIDAADGDDVAALLELRLARIEAHLADRAPTVGVAGIGSASDRASGVDVADLGRHLVGAELAAARLLVAALDPQVDGREVTGGVIHCHGPGEQR